MQQFKVILTGGNVYDNFLEIIDWHSKREIKYLLSKPILNDILFESSSIPVTFTFTNETTAVEFKLRFG